MCVYIQILRNVISALTTAHNNVLNYLEDLSVAVTMDIRYKKIKLLVKVSMMVYNLNTLIKHTMPHVAKFQ